MPGSVGGDVVRIFYLGKKTGVATATTSVLFERITAGFALVGIVLISALFMDQSRPYLISLLILIIIAVALYIIIKLFMKKVTVTERDSSSQSKLSILMVKGKQAIIGIGDTAKNYRNESWQWWGMILLCLSFSKLGWRGLTIYYSEALGLKFLFFTC